jgi:8-oxo-dGTP pyrophosphatase MutT (NUDIX family)
MVRDGEEFDYRDGEGQDWIASWHRPDLPPPDGQRHGSSGICFTSDGDIVLIGWDDIPWEFPGGRPEDDEDWRATLDREVLEEACSSVEEATLLGFVRLRCVGGPQKGLVRVRSLWKATVSVHPWLPQHEITRRQVVSSDEALELVESGRGLGPIYQRWFDDATRDEVTTS